MTVLIAVPDEYVGGPLRPAGWSTEKVVAGFVPDDMEEAALLRLRESLMEWSDGARSIVRVVGASLDRFRPRLTGPDRAYHGIVYTTDTIPRGDYEIIGTLDDLEHVV